MYKIVHVECEFETWSGHLWPSHLCCLLSNHDLSFQNSDVQFIFKGNEKDKSETKTVALNECNRIDFIPAIISQQFHNINGLAIQYSEILVLKSNLLNENFNKIQYLDLTGNKIKQIEAEAFSALTELKWISIWDNEIEEIPQKVFKKNLKLEFINLANNKLQIMHPEIFADLVDLSEVYTDRGIFEKSGSTLSTIFNLRFFRKLKPLFANYIKKYGDPKIGNINLQLENEELKLKLQRSKISEMNFQKKIEEIDMKLKFSHFKYRQATQELQENSKADKSKKILLNLLQNYSKLNRANGDITFELTHGKTLKAHITVLKGF